MGPPSRTTPIMAKSNFKSTKLLAQGIADLVSARLGESVLLRDYPAQTSGDVSCVLLGLLRESRWYALGTVSVLNDYASAEILTTHDGQLTLVSYELNSRSAHEPCAESMAEYVRSGAMQQNPVTVIGAAFELLDSLQRSVSANGYWGLSSTPKRHAWQPPGEAMLHLRGADPWHNVVHLTQLDGGVEVLCAGSTVGSPGVTFTLWTLEQLDDSIPAALEAVRRALKGRTAFQSRSFRAIQVAHQVIRLLAKAEGLRGKLTPRECDQNGFPWKFPSVVVQRVDELGEHDCFTVTETAAGVSMNANTTSLLVTSLTELEASFPQLLEAIRSELSLLTADKLVPGQLYEVVAPIELNKTPIEPGTVLKFCKSDHNYHDGETTYSFETQSAKPDPESWHLSNYAPITPSMSQWLRPFTGIGKTETLNPE